MQTRRRIHPEAEPAKCHTAVSSGGQFEERTENNISCSYLSFAAENYRFQLLNLTGEIK